MGIVALAVAGLGLVGTSASVWAATPPANDCGFRLVEQSFEGAAGSEYLRAMAEPVSAGQDCTAVATATASLSTDRGGSYATDPAVSKPVLLRYLPGLATPSITVDWEGHCADPAAPGKLTLRVASQTVTVAVAAQSCAAYGSPGGLDVYRDEPQQVAIQASGSRAYNLMDNGLVEEQTPSGPQFPDGTGGTPDDTSDGLATTAGGTATWIAAADGGVFTYGTAGFHGSAYNDRLAAPIVGIAATPSGGGYWLVGADGGVFSFGDARFYGSAGNLHLAAPIVGIAATPSGDGYWLVAADGGIFSYGDARFYGSLGGLHLAAPIVGIAAVPSGGGYWLAGSDGGVFSLGDARFYGSAAGLGLNQPVESIAVTADGRGYWLAAGDDGVFSFGDAPYYKP